MPGYVLIFKEAEDDTSAVFTFGPDERQLGRLRLDKQTGEAEELEPAPTEDAETCFVRAAVKLKRLWQAGELPDKTMHASW